MTNRVAIADVWRALAKTALRDAFAPGDRSAAQRVRDLRDWLRFSLYAAQTNAYVDLDDDDIAGRTTWNAARLGVDEDEVKA